MSLTRQDVIKIAHLARLDITEAEVAATHESLSRILGLIEQMNAVDTKTVAPMAHPQDASLRLREDRVANPTSATNSSRSPAIEAGLYLVPKVIE
jgi:aspartyl-tRNA(Asn)/glutamyl-tRNA(Gln) amidotransferase subunit C